MQGVWQLTKKNKHWSILIEIPYIYLEFTKLLII
jgi:hypothetical protein